MSPTSAAQVGLRLAKVADLFASRDEAARAAGVALRTLGRYTSGETEPDWSAARLLCGAKNVDLNWLANGPGDEIVFVGVKRAEEDQARYIAGGEPAPHGFVVVPRYDVRASAGPGALNDDANIKDYLAFREDWIRADLGTSPNEVLCMNAIGDSMEPTIRTGDVLLVDRAVAKVADEAIYVVALEEALLLKRVQPLLGGVVLRSDNPAYGPVTLSTAEAEQLRVFGRVRWYGRVI